MQLINETLGQLQLGEAASFERLTVFPLLGAPSRAADYLTLDEALEAEQARVQEVSDSGSVPELRFDNLGGRRVLLVDGDELIGARQNRIVNLTILVPAHATIEIPVSCVEAGRWAHHSDEFSSGRRSMYARGRASKMEQVSACMKVSGDHYSDQAEVWNDIDTMACDLDVSSPTSAMADLYEGHEERLGAYRKAFKAEPGQQGAVFAINGAIIGLEYFDSPQPFAHYLDKLVGSYAMEAMLARETDGKAVTGDAVSGFLQTVAAASGDAYRALGEGEDLRLSDDRVVGGALVADRRVVHLAAFNLRHTGSYGCQRARHYSDRPVHQGE